MGLFNRFFEKEMKSTLFSMHSFESVYVVKTRNEFLMGKENPVIKLETEAEINFKQEEQSSKIVNSITITSIKGHTDSKTMQPHLQQALAMADISKNVLLERDRRGKLRSFLNLPGLKEDWMEWKEKKMEKIIAGKEAQERFIRTYEMGLGKMNESLKSNLQYLMLMPEIYHFKTGVDYHLNKTSQMGTHSKLLPDFNIRYYLKQVEVQDGLAGSVAIASEIVNRATMENYLKPFYDQQQVYKLNEYEFKINMQYVFQNSTSKIKTAIFSLFEKIHDHLYYKLEIEVIELTKKIEQVEKKGSNPWLINRFD
jgi:hypothetical protein